MNEYDEVDLRDYIEVLLRRKWIVILVTLSATIGAAVISFFVLKPVYQAKTVLLIPKFAPAVISKSMTIEEYINLRTLTPQAFSPETYIGLLKSSSLEEKVIDILDLRKASGEKLSPDELEKMMVAEPVKGADLIEIKVESNDPKMAREIANTWTKLFVEENKKSSIQDAISSESVIRAQFEIAKEELEKAEEEKRAFEEKNKISLLKEEINAKSAKVVEYKTKVSELERSILVEKARIKELQAQLAREKNVILAQSVDNLTAGMSSLEAESFIKAQLEVAKQRLDEAEEEKRAFEAKSKIPILEKEVSNKIDKIAEFKVRLSEIERSLETIGAEIRIWLPELVSSEISAYESRLADIRLTQLKQEWEAKKIKEELRNQSKILVLHKSITEDQYLNQLLAELTRSKAISLSNLKLESEQVNPLYENLKQRLINLNISQDILKEETVKLETAIMKFKELLAELSRQLSNDELEYEKLISVVNANLSKMREVQLGSLRSPMARELEKKLVNATVSIRSFLEERKQLNEDIQEYSKELEDLRAILEAERLRLTDIERAIDIAKSTYNLLSQKLEDARIASTMKTGEVRIVSLATEPKYPIKPRKKQNILISGVLGLFIGTVAAFFVDYWKKDEKKESIDEQA